ncbi:helix-turn-helix transcriptional regulator [Chitinophaga nivalis]|uniref:AraC family transcriptional regulator n=1 Tax=Chitinophaga nivalis TaxID=2991709 RepID=A0ABT3IIS8_9BACT|nr:AraC family transcriptional regulator [Chitinophaga nivalis]MCW3466470.1 AraC family transcriptional regulator [Chitinophaga nivalis]MCW3483839.1 AraC family transcriptional regulator [Chitinophaga nivalis]
MSKSMILTKEQLENFALQGLSFADDHVSDSFNIKDVAERLGISYSYFYHNFTDFMGEPFWHYVKRHRLELAAGLLRHSGYNVSEISELCGYATTAAFSKAFKQHFKESPVNFRRILELPNEKRTLQITESITAATGNDLYGNFFSYDRCEKVVLPDTILYYSFISRGQNPIGEMIAKMTHYYNMFHKMLTLFDLPHSRIITGTLDSVPVTDYEKLSMFAGISIPVTASATLQQLNNSFSFLMKKRVPGGSYLKLPVPMDFATAGIPMYNFISRNCKEGIFKMSGNHFFISLTGPKYCEIFIPLLKKHY